MNDQQYFKSYSSVIRSENGKVKEDTQQQYEVNINKDKMDGHFKKKQFGKEIINKKLNKDEIKQIVEGKHEKYYIPDHIFSKALKMIQN